MCELNVIVSIFVPVTVRIIRMDLQIFIKRGFGSYSPSQRPGCFMCNSAAISLNLCVTNRHSVKVSHHCMVEGYNLKRKCNNVD